MKSKAKNHLAKGCKHPAYYLINGKRVEGWCKLCREKAANG